MIRYRPLDWLRDREPLARLDISLDSDVVYAVARGPLSFALSERSVDPPFHKRYDVSWEKLPAATAAVVAERDERLLGVAAITLREWNRSAVLSDLYVDRRERRRGVGAGLLQEVRHRAAVLGARCLWLETQNVNGPAIHFYQQQGFVCCGVDTALYDPREGGGETAIFFSLALAL